MRREIGLFVAGAALIAGGCSVDKTPSVSTQTKKPETPTQTIPIKNIVNCQANPLDDKVVDFTLKKDEIKRLGAKTKTGADDVIEIKANGDGSFDYMPETNDFSGQVGPGEINIQDKNIVFIAVAGLSGKDTLMEVSMTCNDAVPNASSLPQG